MTEAALTRQRVITELTKSPHASKHATKRDTDKRTPAERLRDAYVPIGQRAAREDQEFFAHLVAWAAKKSEVRDVKVALPVISLATATHDVVAQNALGHLADLDPRMFLRAVEFARLVAPRRQKLYRRLVERYLREFEADERAFVPVVLRHWKVLKALYTRFHVDASARVRENVIQRHPKAGVLAELRLMGQKDPESIAGLLTKYRVPFTSISGYLGKKIEDPAVLQAVIKAMTPNELVNNMKWLEKRGVKNDPGLRAALEQALGKAATSKRPGASLKASKAAEAVADEGLQTKLKTLQEKQLDKMSVDGNWLVLADKSGSMDAAIEAARQIAGVLARVVKGDVHLVFFDSSPRSYVVTGKTYDEIRGMTALMSAAGHTSIGCGLQWALSRKLHVDGIAIVSDGGENYPPIFAHAFKAYVDAMGVEPSVYFYVLKGSSDDVLSINCRVSGIDIQTFDLRAGIDYYSLPNLVQTMRVNRYSLGDEVMETPLVTLDDVLKLTAGKGMPVWAPIAAATV